MPQDLSDLRENLRRKMENAWKDPTIQPFKDSLMELMETATREDFRDCLSGKMPPDIQGEIFHRCKMCALPAPITCLSLVAHKYGLGKKFEEAWKKVPESLKKELMGIENLWTKNDRALAEAVAGSLSLSELYHLCVNDEYGEVQNRLQMPFTPESYRECMSCVARYGDLATAYKRMWGKKK